MLLSNCTYILHKCIIEKLYIYVLTSFQILREKIVKDEIHNLLPIFARYHPEKRQKCDKEMLKVCMFLEIILQLDTREEKDSEHGEKNEE